ncbi:hypothetical protein PQX77_016444 [Marasmius sp. AFHP31]|nr:hypothetical protein PQX77_016444 [Marasmius sp. AFHP31]
MNLSSPFRVLVLVVSLVHAAEIQRKGDLHIVNKVIAPDGFERSTVLSNGEFPGTVITANKGDILEINVFDELTDTNMALPTTVHWHGIHAKGTRFDDGTASVTQCPIVPGNSYNYRVDTAGQTGTYWYHSHYTAQYCDGLRGALIIYDPNDPHKDLYDVDDTSTIISIADCCQRLQVSYVPHWQLLPMITSDLQLPPHVSLDTFAPTWQGPVQPDSTLINGQGRYPGGPQQALAIINVEQGKRYRFRVISMVCDPRFDFSIDGHSMAIIEADGVNHDPVTVDKFTIFAGQRYSAVVNADQPVGNYWIRANPYAPGTPGFDGGINSAILRYKGAPDADPTSSEKGDAKVLQETDLHPTENPGAPGEPVQDGADVNINMLLTLDQDTGRFFINGKSMEFPDVPVMLQIMSGVTNPSEIMPIGSVYELPLNKTIQLSFPTEDGSQAAPHPYHLHGHSFDVVRSAGSSTYNYVNPPRRDVVNIGTPGDNVTIRFRTDNTGPWIMHCHIALHQEAGLAVVMAEDIAGIQQDQNPPAAWNSLCPAYEEFLGNTD